MTRGHRGSLTLRCRAFPSPPPCRFIPALQTHPRRGAHGHLQRRVVPGPTAVPLLPPRRRRGPHPARRDLHRPRRPADRRHRAARAHPPPISTPPHPSPRRPVRRPHRYPHDLPRHQPHPRLHRQTPMNPALNIRVCQEVWTRGHRGSLTLRCRAFPSPPPCRFIPTLQTPEPDSTQASATSLDCQDGFPAVYAELDGLEGDERTDRLVELAQEEGELM